MSLNIKSQENIDTANYLNNETNLKCYNVIASRAYYSVYQKFKYLLVKNNFDYDNFLRNKRTPPKNERPYAHETIFEATTDFLTNIKKLDAKKLTPLVHFGTLKFSRMKADYEDECILSPDAADYLVYAEDIIDLINSCL